MYTREKLSKLILDVCDNIRFRTIHVYGIATTCVFVAITWPPYAL